MKWLSCIPQSGLRHPENRCSCGGRLRPFQEKMKELNLGGRETSMSTGWSIPAGVCRATELKSGEEMKLGAKRSCKVFS